jgi:hypothetical protein
MVVRCAWHRRLVSTRLIEQSFRFALAPEAAQGEAVNSWLGASRFRYNAGLGEVKARLDRRSAGEQGVDLPWSYKGLCSVLDAAWRSDQAPWGSEVPCGTYMAGFEALGSALRNFSAGKSSGRRVGFPRFKCKGRCQESVLFQRPHHPRDHHPARPPLLRELHRQAAPSQAAGRGCGGRCWFGSAGDHLDRDRPGAVAEWRAARRARRPAR